MKATNRQVRSAIFSVFTALLMLLFSSCQTEVFNPADAEVPAPDRAVAETVDGRSIQFLSMSAIHYNSLNKITTSSKYVPMNAGAELKLKAKGNLTAEIKLNILSNTIDYSKTVTMQFDDNNFAGFSDIVFGPHGTQFSAPALLDFEVTGIDLTGINPANVGLYYVNDNGQWEEIVCGQIEVNVGAEIIAVQDAELHHFSRYALAAD